MQLMEIRSWSDYKALIASKKLMIQYGESETWYEIFAPEMQSFMWHVSVEKGTDDGNDFETNFKANANQPLEIKSDAGRPRRMSASPQPNNTTEMWMGFHMDMAADECTKTLDIGFDTMVYMKGGKIYADDANPNDKISVDVVVKAMPTYVVTAGVLKDVYMSNKVPIDFLSSECMQMPNTVMMRVTYTKAAGDNTTRCVSAIADYFKPIS